MSTKAKEDYSTFSFTAKQAEGGRPWIMCEADKPDLPALGHGYLGLRLRPELTFEEAIEIAEYLDDRVEGISHTQFKG
jgi:hypothetical protein